MRLQAQESARLQPAAGDSRQLYSSEGPHLQAPDMQLHQQLHQHQRQQQQLAFLRQHRQQQVHMQQQFQMAAQHQYSIAAAQAQAQAQTLAIQGRAPMHAAQRMVAASPRPMLGPMVASHSSGSPSGMLTAVPGYGAVAYLPQGPAGHAYHVPQQLQHVPSHAVFMGATPPSEFVAGSLFTVANPAAPLHTRRVHIV